MGRLRGIYFHPRGVASVRPGSKLETKWATASYDVDAQLAIADAAEASRVAVLDRDGTRWPHEADITVLRADEDPFGPDGDALGADAFAQPLRPSLPVGAVHYLIGYPSVPAAGAVQAAGRLTRQQLTDIFGGFQMRVLSRGRQQHQLPDPLPPFLPLSSRAQPYYLHGHSANALDGMAGGPVLNGDGKIIGMHLGGRKDTGEYNMFIGTDHPALRAALSSAGVTIAPPPA